MRNRSRWILLSAIPFLAACGQAVDEAPAPSDEGELVVERFMEGDMEVVRNVSGSRWGGNARLELALEIGVDEGDERYMFGNPFPFWATDDEIYVLESRDGRVRVYGFDGQHRRDIGRPGQGPGELDQPNFVQVLPSGKVAVVGANGTMVWVSYFTADGEFVEQWRGETSPGEGIFPVPMFALALEDRVLVPVMAAAMVAAPGQFPAVWERRMGIAELGPEGYTGEPWLAPAIAEAPPTYSFMIRGIERESPVPWSVARPILGVAADGSRLWAHGDRYRFHIVSPDGSKTTAVERVVDPVPVHPDEADYSRATTVAFQRRRQPDFEWNGDDLPEHKPYLRLFTFDNSGRIWVSREGAGQRIDPCTENPLAVDAGEPFVSCWQPEPLMDIFNAEGEYLGSLDRPEGLTMLGPFVDGNRIVAGYQDDMGVSKVRVYRLVLPAGAKDDDVVS